MPAESFRIEVDVGSQMDLDHVIHLSGDGVLATIDTPDLVLPVDHPFGEKETGGQIEIVARRPHGHGHPVPFPAAIPLRHGLAYGTIGTAGVVAL